MPKNEILDKLARLLKSAEAKAKPYAPGGEYDHLEMHEWYEGRISGIESCMTVISHELEDDKNET